MVLPDDSDSDSKPVLVIITREQNLYLKRHGMQKSKFFRQAIEAQRDGKWEYQFLDVPE